LAELGGGPNSGTTEAKMFVDQSIAALRDAIQAGWRQPDKLKEPEFDALRGRPDFQELYAELEKKAKPDAK
jgi:hypothetical protein